MHIYVELSVRKLLLHPVRPPNSESRLADSCRADDDRHRRCGGLGGGTCGDDSEGVVEFSQFSGPVDEASYVPGKLGRARCRSGRRVEVHVSADLSGLDHVFC